jgi:hypothetical protein
LEPLAYSAAGLGASMNSRHGGQIAWREPFRVRARVALLDFRSRWAVPVGAGASLALLGLGLLTLWARSLDEPFNLRAAALMCSAGLLVTFLLVIDDFIPRAIKLGEQAIRIGHPKRPQSVPYRDLEVCDLTTEPTPQFRGFGTAAEPLFTVLWSPDIDPEGLRAFLLAKGVRFIVAPPNPYEALGRQEVDVP